MTRLRSNSYVSIVTGFGQRWATIRIDSPEPSEYLLAMKGEVKTLTIRKRGGKWYACFSCEVLVEPLPPSSEQAGIDVGLTHFATLSDGSHIANPRFFRQEEKALANSSPSSLRRLKALLE